MAGAADRRVSRTTLNADRYLLPTPGQRSGRSGTETILPTWFRKLYVGKVTGAAIVAWQDGLLARGLAPTSVKRHRGELFLTCRAPRGPIRADPVGDVVERTCLRAGLPRMP